MMRDRILHDALISVRHSVPQLHKLLNLTTGIDMAALVRVLDTKLITQLDPDYPLVVAITGGGSTGKSSLFNALVGDCVSPVHARAGLTRRVLAAAHPSVLARPGFATILFEPFGADPEPLVNADDLKEPGSPRYVSIPSVPQTLVLLDTPDFDTGDRDDFANRAIAKPVLLACDVLIYLFTNATYNNRQSTDFMREMLTGIGNRKAILIYRCSRVYSEDIVREHAEVVACNLFGHDHKRWVLGVYRVNEDDRVTAGNQLMDVIPTDGTAGVHETLASISCMDTRTAFIESALREVHRNIQKALVAAENEIALLEVYRDAARIATSWAVTKSLKSYPQAELLARFLTVWESTAPVPLKLVRGVGRVCALPLKPLSWLAKHVRNQFWKVDEPTPRPEEPNKLLEQNLLEAANELRNQLRQQALTVQTTSSDVHGRAMIARVTQIAERIQAPEEAAVRCEPCGRGMFNLVVPNPQSLVTRTGTTVHSPWPDVLEQLSTEAAALFRSPADIDVALRELAVTFRRKMTRWQNLREVLTASLSALPAAGAVTYVLLTADPVGGATIHAKLTALFGVHDLWVIAAAPLAELGLDAAARQMLQTLLSQVFGVWFGAKASQVNAALSKHISGPVIDATGELLDQAVKPITEIQEASLVIAEQVTP